VDDSYVKVMPPTRDSNDEVMKLNFHHLLAFYKAHKFSKMTVTVASEIVNDEKSAYSHPYHANLIYTDLYPFRIDCDCEFTGGRLEFTLDPELRGCWSNQTNQKQRSLSLLWENIISITQHGEDDFNFKKKLKSLNLDNNATPGEHEKLPIVKTGAEASLA
jgi:hypothetical protein